MTLKELLLAAAGTSAWPAKGAAKIPAAAMPAVAVRKKPRRERLSEDISIQVLSAVIL